MFLTGKEIRQAARTTISVLKLHGLAAYLVGGAACAIYGMKNRIPNDVDVVVITSLDPESIKRLLTESSNHFYTVPSTNRRNTYRVLWFSKTASLTEERLITSRLSDCKVDILVPGLLGIPEIPVHRIVYLERYKDIPVGPFLEVLLLKLKAWVDHSVDHRSYMRAKAPIDLIDVEELLKLANEVYGIHLKKEAWMPSSFIEEARGRVRRHSTWWPLNESKWKALGF